MNQNKTTLKFISLLLFFLPIIVITSKKITHQKRLDYGNTRFGIDLKKGTFIKDDKPFRYIAGEIHYFRIHPSVWEDRLQRVRHLGLNAVQIYVPWNFHEKVTGVIDFEGDSRNLVRFLQLAHKNELNVLLRIGPYVCAEWENGGLPWWLLKTPNISMRTADERFLTPALRFWDTLLPLIKNYLYINSNDGPIIMIQVENEYGSLQKCDKVYMQKLRDHVYEHLGQEVTLYTTDGISENLLKCGTIDNVYPTVDFGPSNNVRDHFQLQQKFSGGGPNVNSEFYTTWFTSWGDSQLPSAKPQEVLQTLSKMNDLNASYSFYMVHGGTNFEFWNGAEVAGPVLTSYDYVAPIGESGDISPLYVEIRNWIQNLTDWKQKPLDLPKNFTAISIKEIQTIRIPDFLSVVKKLTDENNCRSSETPLPFEEFSKPYTFFLYSTTLASVNDETSTNLLSFENIQNVGYIFLDNKFQGIVSSLCKIADHSEWCTPSLILNLLKNKEYTLSVLVENTARITFETINDYKGILKNVTLNNKPLTHWLQCGVDFERLSLELLYEIKSNSSSLVKNTKSPAVYLGTFSHSAITDWSIYNTYFDARKWSKGFVIVNGFNLGRYWTSLGPQKTLFTPGSTFVSKDNVLIVVELMGQTHFKAKFDELIVDNSNEETNAEHYAIEFIDHPIF